MQYPEVILSCEEAINSEQGQNVTVLPPNTSAKKWSCFPPDSRQDVNGTSC